MSQFFAKFPVIAYNLDGSDNNLTLITNLLFRTRLLQSLKNNLSNYYYYTLKDGESPEIVAEKYYGTPETHWLVMYANDVVDPQFDWFLTQDEFNAYLTAKYGSISNAMAQIHHYVKNVITIDSVTGLTTTKSYEIDFADNRTIPGDPTIPYDTYSNLADLYVPTIKGKFKDGSGETMYITRSSVTCYDYEDALNEKKRTIRLINKSYLPEIMSEFNSIAKAANPNQFQYIRNISK